MQGRPKGKRNVMKVLVGVTGSIAAYKTASVVSALVSKGHEVRVCMTKAATKFVGPVTFSALSHQPVILDEDEFAHDGHIMHIEMAQEWAERLLIAPASYDFIGKLVFLRADDALSSICAAWRGTILVCPAMNTIMWKNLQAVLETNPYSIRRFSMVGDVDPNMIVGMPQLSRKVVMLKPSKKKLACGTDGEGAIRPTRDIVTFLETHG